MGWGRAAEIEVRQGIEENSRAVFNQEALEFLVDFLTFLGIEFLAAVFEEFINFGILIAADIGTLSGMPESVLIRVVRNLLTDKHNLVIGRIRKRDNF